MSVFGLGFGLWACGQTGLRVLAAADFTLDSLSSGRCRLDPLLATTLCEESELGITWTGILLHVKGSFHRIFYSIQGIGLMIRFRSSRVVELWLF
jgi:hypothetical protein